MDRIHMVAMGTLALALSACAVGGEEIVGADQAALKSCGLDCPDPGGGDPIDPPPPPPDPTSTSTSTPPPPPPPPTPISGVPQGLTGGLAYFVQLPAAPYHSIYFNGWMNGVQTITESGSSVGVNGSIDADTGLLLNAGFCHQERNYPADVTDRTKSALFALPPGAVCGFRHTQHSPVDQYGGLGKCMGVDVASGYCPAGFRLRSHFDMKSGDGTVDCSLPANLDNTLHCGNWVWCEYLDPNGFCPIGSACEQSVVQAGYLVGLHSNADPQGEGLRGAACPAGTYRSAYYDAGRSAGQGLSACIR